MKLRHAIVDQLRLNARAFPERPAIEIVGGETLSFADAWKRTLELAAAIDSAMDGAATRRVAILLPNGADAVLTYLAVQLAGCSSVPVNGRLAAGERSFILTDSEASLLVVSEPFLGEVDALDVPQALAVLDAGEIGALDESSGEPEYPPVEGDVPFLVGYTSGTTGFPKGGIFTNDEMLVQYHRWGWQFGLTAEHTLLTVGPMFHNSYGGLSVLALMAGATNRIMTSFEPAVAAEELRHNATFAMLIPSMMGVILEAWRASGRAPMDAARFLLSSGAAISVGMLDAAAEAFPNATIAEAYGWSEGGWVTYEVKDRSNLRSQCVGWPMVGVEIITVRADGTLADVGEPGEIAVKNISPFHGYLNRPDATRAAETADGFLLSGDVGVIDEDGRIRLVDRLKDMIVTGGENVYSAEVERVVIDHPEVSEVAVVGEDDDHWGEAVVAYVVASGPLQVDDLRSYCREHLADYKVPKRFYLVEVLPRNSMGKIQKFKLRERAAVS